jgi:hypothetical protein
MASDRRPSRRRPNAIVSSAAIITAAKLERLPKPATWQEEAWAFYDSVGEVRQATGWLANAMSRCRLVAARKGHGGDEPAPIIVPEEGETAAGEGEELVEPTGAERLAAELVERLAGGTEGQAQLLSDFAVPLSVPGVAWLVGEPSGPPPDQAEAAARLRPDGRPPTDGPEAWQVFSEDVMGKTPGPVGDEAEPRLTVRMGEGRDDVRVLSADALAVRVWRGHKRWHYRPDSPMRAVLGPLRRLALFADHLEANGVSRLAGAGVLVLPEEMTFASSEKNKDAADPFIADLIDTMTTAIRDRDNASAVVPLVVRVKGELIEKIRHLTFATPFQAEVDAYIDKELRRFATGMDLPAEIVLGLGEANHWTAWQIEESGLKLHVEPMLEAVCSALTSGFLRPALAAAGISAEDAGDLIVWFDTSELTVRPDRSGDAKDAYDRKAIGARSYRREIGMSDDDAPDEEELKRAILLEVIQGAPTLAPLLLRELGIEVDLPDTLPTGAPASGPAEGDDEATGPPDTQGDPPPPPGADAALETALLAAADQMVYRALERAGARLGNATRSAGIRYTGPNHLAHTTLPEEVRASCLADGGLLDGAWDRVPELATRYRVEPEALRQALDDYTRGLLASGWPHEYDALGRALGAGSVGS